ncbi:MAG: MerR family transcriptional regulator [Sulfurimonas sp. RIFOXYD12_FULL_33_39]|uniref:MerR family transcriptional regulator n=1 Tax=unclassified Sulfurimonas TaxID=2623549 RepID=UPI0008C19A6D|nr:MULTISPECIES: MerR family transcriptional regulator [unclassified Sulfurimonas]OHE05100.1 MAG: MerR family transcriptional regulator [Sulfurimonas sp. RIFCSPLOWO2_12_FULL_34_6]OHE10928.1 MAG: MerR family transcriptional regulator [Sulfurimonas sp. RIFOXYD12_FULL_33_39]OHE13302.1 MAG: MerR family transcriptional regulator [Sulfurimonas sp. RIFOXYD2_FULL_34_21]
MEYKISELVAQTDVPKSTILYYIREGLLPEAKKLKSNVHRYSNEHIELIKYIKYMKQEMGSSNEEIKHALENKNQSLSSSFSMLAPLMQTLSAIPSGAKHYTKKEFIEHYDIDIKLLQQLLIDGILVPINSDDFTDKEASIIRLIEDFKEVGIEYTLIRTYVHHAKILAELEHNIQKQLCSVRSDENFSTLWKIMFETLFNAKEYLFSRYTHNILFKALKDEISKNHHQN